MMLGRCHGQIDPMSQLPSLFEGRITLLLRWVVALLGLLIGLLALRTAFGILLFIVGIAGVICLKLGDTSKQVGWIGTGLSGLLVALFMWIFFLYPIFGSRQARIEAISQLKAAKSEAELRESVGGLGLFLESTNGWWIAIRYRDSHAGGIWSVAVAKDSDGEMHESHHHFCGKLSIFGRDWESYSKGWKAATEQSEERVRQQQLEELEKLQGQRMKIQFPELLRVAQATNLAEARIQLHKAWFSRIEKP